MPTTEQPQKRKRPLTDAHLNSLPLWKLLSIAMVDLRKQERAKNSEVDMRHWLSVNGKCSACLAGSVLRFSCGIGETIHFARRNWAYAVNILREGCVSIASDQLERPRRKCADFNRNITDYHADRDGFWRDITKLRDDLKKAGL